jgi:hypothetical protein
MFSARFVTVFALAAGIGFMASNCGSSDDGGSSNNNLNCPSNTGTGTCTAEQNKAYSDCIISKCDAQYQACLGAGYKSGSYSGPCGAWIGCTAKCGCGDTACRSACGLPDATCQACFTGQLATCVTSSGCTAPVCTGTGTGGTGGGTGGTGGGTGGTGGSTTGGCGALMKCCASANNASIKSACEAQYNALKSQAGSDMACSLLAGQYKMAGYCTF